MIRSLNGKTPVVHPTAFVSEFAYVVGDVEIGEYSSVWPGTVIRGDTAKITIGRHTNIQDNCVIHGDRDTTIGDYCTIGHRVMCHARVVGDHCLIGNGAVLNDGVQLGQWSIVASGAMVLENKEFPESAFVVGMPAELKGRTMERHRTLIEETGKSYAEKAQLYKSQGLGDSLPPAG
ncbi:MAG: gamma carbonic anhydrase family protein [Chloroflexi bacterium]|nr:gamma carbonic anhydrase family protein [Chloroflexota bacterium]